MKKHKFTWIDAVVIVVVVLLIAGTCVKFLVNDTTSVTQDSVEFTYQLRISNIRQMSVDSLQVGDAVYDNEGKGCVGVISAVDVEPYTTTYNTDSGEIVNTTVEGRYTVILTLTADGTPTGDTYKVGTYTLNVNSASTYFTKYSIWSATIISID